jgi:ribosomal protein S18 acetylase RimI-like enzyme
MVLADVDEVVLIETICFELPWPRAHVEAFLLPATAAAADSSGSDAGARRYAPSEPLAMSAVDARGRVLGFLLGTNRAADGEGVGRSDGPNARGSSRLAPERTVASLAVRPGARGCGIAEALLKTALADARARGAPCCSLQVHQGNIKAQRLYERCGFVVAQELPGYYAKGMVQIGSAFRMVCFSL